MQDFIKMQDNNNARCIIIITMQDFPAFYLSSEFIAAAYSHSECTMKT